MHNRSKPLQLNILPFFLNGVSIALALLFLSGCSGQGEISDACKSKISTALVSVLSEVHDDNRTIDVVVSLNDSSGIMTLFPSLNVPNSNVALGHLTKKEIFSLCMHIGVSYIDKPRMSYPNPKLQ